MVHIVLFEPEIPPNTGSIIRLCANTGARLHLIHPLGFTLDNKQLKRAGLDYHEWVDIYQYANYAEFIARFQPTRLFACSTRGTCCYSTPHYKAGDAFLFGSESRGLPAALLSEFSTDTRLRLPMRATSRSLNLANAVAVIVYEAWRQLGFKE